MALIDLGSNKEAAIFWTPGKPLVNHAKPKESSDLCFNPPNPAIGSID